jgi:hypothetical protein
MVYEVRKLSVWSVAKVSFLLGGVLGFAAGLFFWMFAGLLSQLPMADLGDVDSMAGLKTMGAVMPFLLAMIYAVMLMIVNGLLAGAYNLLAGFVGGIECTLVQQPAYAPAWPAPPQGPPAAQPFPPGPPGPPASA